jgi:hypothetical protein
MRGRHGPVESKRIVVANEPRSYREAMAVAWQVLRPEVEVILAEPRDLDAEVARLDPQLVLCSRLTEGLRAGSRAWVVLYRGVSRDECFQHIKDDPFFRP